MVITHFLQIQVQLRLTTVSAHNSAVIFNHIFHDFFLTNLILVRPFTAGCGHSFKFLRLYHTASIQERVMRPIAHRTLMPALQVVASEVHHQLFCYEFWGRDYRVHRFLKLCLFAFDFLEVASLRPPTE